MMKKKLLTVVIFSVIMMLLASACGSVQKGEKVIENQTAEKNENNKVANIKVAIVATGNVATDFQEQIDRFNKNHNSIKVEILTFSSGDAYRQALMGQIAGGVAPDVFLLDGGIEIKNFVENKAIQPLDELSQKAGIDISNFYESLIQAVTVKGKIYGIPKDYNTTALFYHKDILEEAGIEPPKTWEELREAAKALTTKDRFGFGINPQINYYYPFIKSAGADFVTAEGINKEVFLSDEHVEALDFIISLFTEDKSTASPQMVAAGWDGEMFANKKVAMLYGGTWIPGVILQQNPDLKIGAVPLPIKKGKASMLYTAGWVISSKSENLEAAMELVKFLTSDEEIVWGNKKGLIGLPPTKSGMEKLMEAKKDDPFLPVYKEVVQDSVPFGWIDPKFVDEYNKMMEGLVYKPGEKTPKEALEEIVVKIN